MNILYRTLQVAVMVMAVTCSAFTASAQNLWLFNKDYTPQYKEQWVKDHVIPATANGKGLLTAVDSEGKPLERYDVVKNRPLAGPFKAGDAYVFEVPVENAVSGAYVDFDATFSIEDGAPMNWALEIMDGGEWIEGKKFRCYGPGIGKDYRYTSAYHTFRLKNGSPDGKVRIRLRALEGDTRPVREGKEATADVLFVTTTYVGVMVNDFGTEAPKDTTKVLCLGNSFTYYCGTPVLLKEIAWSEGHYVDVSASLKGGWTMEQHLSLQTTDDLVAEGGYDYVILQDQSAAPAKVGQDRKTNAGLVASMVQMADKVRSQSPDCKAVVECTWAYTGKNNAGFESYEAFYKYGRKGAKIMAKAVGDAKVSPISKAFEIVRKERPDINLYHTDNHHQCMLGSYLKSCVNYLVLFGEPFGDNPADCLQDKDTAQYLRDVAERVVLK